jgi:amino acid transporter
MPVLSSLKRLLIGKPIATKRAHHERLIVFFGLALLASDNISIIAYATEEMQHMLGQAGDAALRYTMPLGMAIIALVMVVLFSYSRTVQAYPQGGGDYKVASENLSPLAGLIAGASLLIDYTLTVAVSVSAGVLAIVSAFPITQPYTVHLGVMSILLLTIVNMRGTRESGMVFAVPTYSFVFLLVLLIGFGLPKVGTIEGAPAMATASAGVQAMSLWLLLKAFAAGCAALTGIEAIANGTTVFRPPEAKNAVKALLYLGGIMFVLFLGVTWLATHLPIRVMEVEQKGYQTVVAQVAQLTFGSGSFMFFAIQISTMAILILAANTAYADFPRLASFIGRDGYLPRQLANLGDRLVFQNGIMILAAVACALIVFARGDVHKLIPLYALGVFTAFTLGQAGMVVRQVKTRMPLWGTALSAIGMAATGVVWFVILITKFTAGAWMIVIALGVLLYLFAAIRRHYDYLARALDPTQEERPPVLETTVLLLVPPRVHRGILQAIAYANTLGKDRRAIHVTDNPATIEHVKEQWEKYGGDIPLVILESPYRSLVEPLMEYIDEAITEREGHMLTVVVPQAIAKKWWHNVLHNNAALPLKMALASRKNVVISNVRYFLQ